MQVMLFDLQAALYIQAALLYLMPHDCCLHACVHDQCVLYHHLKHKPGNTR